MKKIYLILSTIIFLQFYACHDALDTVPTDFLNPVISYETAENLEKSLTAIYDVLGDVYGTNWLYRYGLEADEGRYGNHVDTRGLTYNTYNASEPAIEVLYTRLFLGVTRANMLLENVDNNPEIDKSIRDRIRGEALFLRGHYYFLLVKMFGGVPLVVTNSKTPNEVHVPRATALEIYEQIVKDMTAAEEIVSDIQTLGYGGRVNKSAVRGSLAKVYLHMAGRLGDKSKYVEAEKWALKVIEEGYHELNPNYSNIFINYARDEYDTKESLFEVEYWGNRSGTYLEAGQVGVVVGPKSLNPETGIAQGAVRVNQFLFDLYKEGDLRCGWNIANFSYDNTGECGAKTFLTERTQIYDRMPGKYRREYEVVTPRIKSWSSQNYPLLRYSDVLLMYAEANNEINGAPTSKAIDAVNQVRRRAWATGGIKSFVIIEPGTGYTKAPTIKVNGDSTVATAMINSEEGALIGISLNLDAVTGKTYGKYIVTPTVTITGGGGSGAVASVILYKEEEADLTAEDISSQTKFREAIQNERARELCFEGLRKFDLIRWGIYVSRMHEIGDQILSMTPAVKGEAFSLIYKNIQEKHNLFPIPESELIRNNALVGHQNPGWE
ncbi:MAG: RagB/SusD family nutrient uptake outer membrane protein [Bacteroidales bacterium]|nr:RagB/SusD family nutrient uptake outer membrane protein [Bacteroidales bacterium]